MKEIQPDYHCKLPLSTRPPLLLSLLPLLLVLAWAGCKPHANDAADTNPVGTYALVSADGKKVPCNVEHDGHTIAVKSGSFIINADGTCSSKMEFSLPSGPQSTREVKAKYTRDGTRLDMLWEGAGRTTGTIEGGTFTMNNAGMVLVYRK